MRADREKWEARYGAGERVHDGPPAALLKKWLPLLPRGRALDVATGLGRNALLLASAGYDVCAVDISSTALAVAARRAARRRLQVRWVEADLDTYRFPKARYHVVVNTFFLKRKLLTAMQEAVRPGGVMILETHLESPEPDPGPRGPAHRLKKGELQRRFRHWEVLYLEEGLFRKGGRYRALGRIVARKPRGTRK